MGEWKRVKLGEICSKIGSGATPTGGKSAYKDDGVSLIRSQNVLDMSFAMAGLAHIDDEQARKLDGVTVCGGDVLLNITGDSVARCCIAPNHVLPARVNQHVCIVRPRSDLAESRFVEYFLIAIKDRLLTLASAGATRNALTKETIQNLEVPLPDLPTQRRIAAVLGALDDKIEVNRKICENLEAQAQALFKAWFVDFEPFGGNRPEGWKEIPLSAIADFYGGYSYKGAELQESDCAMVTIKNFDRGGGFKLNGFKEIVPSSKLKHSHEVDLFDTLVAHTDLTQNAEVIGNAEMLLSKAGYKKIIMSMDLVKVVPKHGISRFLLGALLKNGVFKSHCLRYVNGTTVLHLSKMALTDYTLDFPDDPSVLDSIAQTFESIYRKIAVLIDESRALAAMRDAQLPKLMSGELAVEKVALF